MGPALRERPAALQSVLLRWPALLHPGGPALLDALREVRYGHRPGHGEDDLSAAEPLLARLMEQGPGALRREALGAWLALVERDPGPSHVQALLGAVRRDPDREFLVEALEAAGWIADAGALSLLAGYQRHPDPLVRRALARGLSRAADPASAQRLLVDLLRDDDPAVRAAAVAGAARAEGGADRLADLVGDETEDEPLCACVAGLVVCCRGPGHAARPLQALERLAAHPSVAVRRQLALAVPETLPQRATLLPVVRELLGDADPDVRRECAWSLRAAVGSVGAVVGLLRQVACVDTSGAVRAAAVSSLAATLPSSELRPLAGADASPEELLGFVDGVRGRGEPEVRTLLTELAAHPDPRVASAARQSLGAAPPD